MSTINIYIQSYFDLSALLNKWSILSLQKHNGKRAISVLLSNTASSQYPAFHFYFQHTTTFRSAKTILELFVLYVPLSFCTYSSKLGSLPLTAIHQCVQRANLQRHRQVSLITDQSRNELDSSASTGFRNDYSCALLLWRRRANPHPFTLNLLLAKRTITMMDERQTEELEQGFWRNFASVQHLYQVPDALAQMKSSMRNWREHGDARHGEWG